MPGLRVHVYENRQQVQAVECSDSVELGRQAHPPASSTWDSIPRTTTWKVRRLELRRRLEVGQFPGPGG